MRKILLALLVVPGVVFADVNIFDNNTWFLGDKTLTTKRHASLYLDGKGFDFSIEYVKPSGEHGSSDACALTSPTSLSCFSGDSVTYRAETHAATLEGRSSDAVTYYEKGYEPLPNPITGEWRREREDQSFSTCNSGNIVSIVIPYHQENATTFNNVDEYFSHGFSKGGTYYLIKDNMGHLVLSKNANRVSFSSSFFYLYDANNNSIDSLDKLNTLAKLNDGATFSYSFSPQCTLIRK